ncbi:unnamed protein product [Calypogeia fissa]
MASNKGAKVFLNIKDVVEEIDIAKEELLDQEDDDAGDNEAFQTGYWYIGWSFKVCGVCRIVIHVLSSICLSCALLLGDCSMVV